MQNKNSPEGLEDVNKRFVKFGGGVSNTQLEWLGDELAGAHAAQQRVIVFCHLPLHPGTAYGPCLLWNYEEVLGVMHAAGNVVATFSGHSHQVSCNQPHSGTRNTVFWRTTYRLPYRSLQLASFFSKMALPTALQDGYARDEAGIHHRTLAGVVETPPVQDCYGWVDVYEDHLQLTGAGALESVTMPFRTAEA